MLVGFDFSGSEVEAQTIVFRGWRQNRNIIVLCNHGIGCSDWS